MVPLEVPNYTAVDLQLYTHRVLVALFINKLYIYETRNIIFFSNWECVQPNIQYSLTTTATGTTAVDLVLVLVSGYNCTNIS